MIEKLDSLNSMQREAVINTDGAMLVLAGAGSGKTRVLTHRIAYLIEKGIRPFNILAITFTNKAAKEMKERVSTITQDGDQVFVSTFHSMCVRILRQHIESIGYTKSFSIYDSEDSEKLLKEIVKEQEINTDLLSVRAIQNAISSQKDKVINATKYFETVGSTDIRKKQIANVYLEYEKRLKINNALDFDDLLLKTVELFTKDKEALLKYQDRFKYIMVDEYQDTSECQYILINMLADKHRNICIVGDDDQSIYSFRGANVRNMSKFEDDFAPVKVIKLEENYRSTKTILDVANTVIANNFNRKGKTLITGNDDGEKVSFEKCTSDRTEAAFVANTILEAIKNNYEYKDCAILYRNNSLSRVIEEQLVFLSIPYRVYGGVNFYGRKEIKDIIAYLKVIENPSDTVAIKRIINVPKRGIGATTITKIENYATENNITFFEAMGDAIKITNLGRITKNLVDFYNLLDSFILDAKTLGIAKLIETILENTGYITELKKDGTEQSQSRIDNLSEFTNRAYEFDEEEGTGLTEFLETISLVADIDSMEESDNVVSLMTLHSSKGLEFPVVFIVGFEEGIFPSIRAITNGEEDIEEERRLLYVGITRAKEKLYITSADSRLQHGKYMDNTVSSFYKELPKELIDVRVPKRNEGIQINDASNHNKYRPTPKYAPNIFAHLKKDIPTPKNVVLDFSVGDSVTHSKFGAGEVLNISPAGADYEVLINFDKVGEKKLMANLSKVKKL